jgi:hypothetical protein
MGTGGASRKPAAGAVRLSLAALTLVAGVILCGCGGGGAEEAGGATPTRPEKRAQTPGAAQTCRHQLNGFLDSLDALRSRLAVGLSYGSYMDGMRGVRAAYNRIPVHHLDISCLMTVGTPGEHAFDRYVDAANIWAGCLSVAGCDSYAVEPKLQRKWQLASASLSEARRGLRRMAAARATGAG